MVAVTGTTNASWNPSEVAAYIQQAATARGIDPNTAVAVARTEGLNNPVGDAGASFGPFQLYTHGGLGNSFQNITGLNPANYLENWKQQVDFFLNWAVTNGWNPGAIGLGSTYQAGTGGGSHGASAAGISNRQGLSGSFAVPIGSDTSTNSATTTPAQTDTETGATTTVTASSNPSQPTSMNLSFADSIQHSIVQILLVLVGIALLLGGIYLIGSKA